MNRPAVFVMLTVGLLGTAWRSGADEGARLRVGVAAIEIEADDSMPIAGSILPRFVKGQEGKLRATAFLVARGQEPPVAVVSCDVLFVTRDFVDPALAEIERRTGIPAANVMVHATHTHHAPSTSRVHGYDRCEPFVERLRAAIVQAVIDAKARLAETTFSFALGQENTVGSNSRLMLGDGTIYWGGPRDDAVGPTGPFDPDLPVLAFRDASGKLQAMLFGHSTHTIGALGGNVRSPAFYGMVAQALETELGGTAAFLEGASGSTHSLGKPAKESFAAIKQAVLAALAEARPQKVQRVASLKRPFVFKVRRFDEAAEDKAVSDYCHKRSPRNADPVIDVFRQMRKDLAPRMGQERTSWVQTVVIGDVAVVGVPAEFFTKLGLEIKRRSPFRHTVIAELSNDWIGYVGDREAYNLGGYQLWMGLHSYCEPGTGERIVDQAVAMLDELDGKAQAAPPAVAPPAVCESAREIPVAYSVDVLVAGGSTGAVAAAVAAAQGGAKVFLAAPRPYLGDDMAGTLRIWLEEGEQAAAPLARALLNDAAVKTSYADPHRLPFRYQADQPSSAKHRDTDPPGLLSDQEWGYATKQSVQYDADVNIVLDLDGPRQVAKVRVWAYQRSDGQYRVGSVALWASDDQKQWKPVGTVENRTEVWDTCPGLSIAAELRTRYLKLAITKSAKAERMLLGEIEGVAPAPEGAPTASDRKPWPRPMHIKRTLDEALLGAKVDFLYSCYPTDVLHDAQGQVCGMVMANRAGRQAVLAKTVIDATDRAVLARLAGARFRPYAPGPQTFRRVVIGGEVQKAPGMTARVIEPAFVGPHPNRARTQSGLFPIIEYTLSLPMADGGFASWAKADQQARTLTYHVEQQFTSDVLFQVPPDPMFGQETAQGEWRSAAALPEGAFRPKDVARLLVLGGCADVSRAQAEKLLRPAALIEVGTRLGEAAAAEAQPLAAPAGARVRGKAMPKTSAPGDVRELLAGPRSFKPAAGAAAVPQEARPLAVLGRYDVVVIGGGTAGAPAGIAAARQGAKTLVVEQLCGLGGVGTLGSISSYCQGNRVGFTAEVGGGNSWVIEEKMHWWRTELLKAGADIWFGCTGCGTLVDRDTVRGAVVATPHGRGVVLAKVVIDATGGADMAAAAGAACYGIDEKEFAIQGTGLPPRELGASYRNSDYSYTDDTDMLDAWHFLVYSKNKYPHSFDVSQLIDTRERRRIVGDWTLTVIDQVSGRTYPDSIAQAHTSLDTHGYIIDPMFLLRHPMRNRFTCYVPYRCLLPKGLEGILVTGIGLSAHRDAQPLVRMQPDVQNQGYAAGVAAALAAKADTPPRHIDVRALQEHLVKIGNLPESVLSDVDSHPLPRERIQAAVDRILEDYPSTAIILGHAQEALPMLRKALATAEGDKRRAYAKVLGFLGDTEGLETLLAESEAADQWDSIPHWRIDKDWQGYTRVGWSMSHLDNTLVALGRTRRPEAVPAVLKMLALLRPKTSFSHHRAVFLALEWIGDRRAAEPLAELLRQPDMGGHAVTSIDQRSTSDASRQTATRELALARALYRCGDWEGLGEKTLVEYTKDLRGLFARHAQAVLAAGKDYRPGQ